MLNSSKSKRFFEYRFLFRSWCGLTGSFIYAIEDDVQDKKCVYISQLEEKEAEKEKRKAIRPEQKHR